MVMKYTVDSSYLPKDLQIGEKYGKWFLIQTNIAGNKIRSNLKHFSMVIFTSHLKNKYLCLAIRQDLKWKRHGNNAPYEDQ
jgi:hypothetical protein